jgi:uncharacterized membrane protein
MALFFQNQYSDTVWIAFLYEDTGCGATPWHKMGWWQVDSGTTFNAWNTDLRGVNRYAAFYAEEYRDSGGATWSGNGNNWYLISDTRFDQCYDNNSNCNQQPDFIPLDFNGYADLTVTLGPNPGQLATQGSVPLPDHLDFDWNPIVFGGGVPVGGYSHLTIRKDGSYSFTGHFHDSGGTEYNMALAWVVADSENRGYSFEHQGHVAGTFESGSRDDNWQVDGQNDAIAENWASIVARDQASGEANANGDLTALINSLIGTLGTVLGIIAIVAA